MPEREPDVPRGRGDRRCDVRRQPDGRAGPEVLSAGPAVRPGSAVLRAGGRGRRRVPAADDATTARRLPGGGRRGDGGGLRLRAAKVRRGARAGRRVRRRGARADGRRGPVGRRVAVGLLLRRDAVRGAGGQDVPAARPVLPVPGPLHVRQQVLQG